MSKEHTEITVRRSTINASRKIIVVSKITAVHIQHAINKHDIDPHDDGKARVWAIFDFLYFEMKLPEDEFKDMKILRTFRPARKPDSDTLYAEFEDEASVNLINL